MPKPNGKPQIEQEVPTVTVQLVPGALVGQSHQIQVLHENCSGWPMVVQLLNKAIEAALPKAYGEVAQESSRIQMPGRN